MYTPHVTYPRAPRVRDEREEEDLQSERRLVSERPRSIPHSVTKSFHTTISEDRTDQEALEGQRLVALQEKSEWNHPLGSVRPSSQDPVVASHQENVSPSSSKILLWD